MKNLNSRSEETIFWAALQYAPEERGLYLDKECAGKPALRQRIEELLKAQPELGEFMEKRPAPDASAVPEAEQLVFPPEERPGSRIGRYKILQKIGEGGCGVVYMAEQEEPVKRRVALKVIKLGMDTKSVIARFDAERQALAMMDHPNIARILDAGATETGRPYFVMELVRGTRITDFCDQNRLPTRERLNLFIQVCQAVQHAHQKGVIHRDLKPSNILVTVHDPGAPGVPMIIDFGIAKATQGRLTDQTLFTAFEQFLGTPAYMSPEQAMMTALDIDTRSDIYSLGVLLYELLTGRTPFDAKELLAAGVEEMRRTIREKEPLRPSTRLGTLLMAEQTTAASLRGTEPPKLVHLVRGDLDWIVMKCLEKDRARRYEGAGDLAADIQRHLNHEAVLARPASTAYRFRRLVRRNKFAFGTAAAVAGSLMLGAGFSTWQAIRATHAGQAALISKNLAEKAQAREHYHRELAEVRLYAADMYAAQQAFESGNLGRARDLLKVHWPKPGEPDLRGFEWRYLWQLCRGDNLYTFSGHSKNVRSVAFSEDGKMLASGGADPRVMLWDVPNRRLVTTLSVHKNGVHCLAFSNDGRTLATADDDGIKLWNVETHQLTFTLLEENAARVAFSPVGTLLAIGYGHPVFGSTFGGPMKLWNYITHEVARTFPEPGSRLAFSPNGKILATRSNDDSIKLWNVETGQEMRKLHDAGEIYCLSFSPDGQSVVGGNGAGEVLLWNVVTGERVLEFKGHTGMVWSLAFSSEGKMLATGGTDQLRLWNTTTAKEEWKVIGHDSVVKAVAFAPDGQTLATGGKDATVMLWSTAPKESEIGITNVDHPPAFSPDSKLLAVSTIAVGPTTVWDTVTRLPLWILDGERRPQFSPDGKTLATISTNSMLRFWDTATKTLRRSFPLPGTTDSAQQRFSMRGNRLATADFGGNVTLYDLMTGDTVGRLKGHVGEIYALTFSQNGGVLAMSGVDRFLKLWDVATQSELSTGSQGTVNGLAFSPDGSLLAIGSWDETVRLLNVDRGEMEFTLSGIKDGCSGVAFSPDARTLAVACEDGTVRLWNLATQREVILLRHGKFAVRYVEFSPDGQTLVSVCVDDGTLRFWNAPSSGVSQFEQFDSTSPVDR